MKNEELQKKLKEIRNEDLIWYIYIVLIFISLYSNVLERKYLITNDQESKKHYKELTITVFVVLLIIYIYFLNLAKEDLDNIKSTDSKNKKELSYLSFVASVLVTISGILYLYIALNNDNVEVEVAFS